MPTFSFDQIIDRVARPDAPGGAVAVSLHNELIFERGFGLADAATQRPFGARTSFHVCSITKTFTGALAGLLEQTGRLTFDDTVRSRLPSFPDYGVPLTLDHLVTNTSGLRDYFGMIALEQAGGAPRYAREPVERHSLTQPSLMFSPGERYSYSNSNFVALCRVIETVDERAYADALTGRIVEPLGLSDTLFLTDTVPEPEGAAVGHVKNGEAFTAPRLSVFEAGDGGVWSTAADLASWGSALVSDRVGRPGLTSRITSAGRFSDGATAWYAKGFGSGWRGKNRWFGHSGGLSGMSTNLACFPDSGLVIAVGLNGPLADADDLAFQLADRVLGAPETHPPPRQVDGRLESWSGVWQGDGAGPTAVLTPRARHVDLWLLGWNVQMVADGETLTERGSGVIVRRISEDEIALRPGPNAFIRMRRLQPPNGGEVDIVGRYRGVEVRATLSLQMGAIGLEARVEEAAANAPGWRLETIAENVGRLLTADGAATGGVLSALSRETIILSLPRAEKLRFERIQ